MINLEIIAYIEGQKKAGTSDSEIMNTLVKDGGWLMTDVKEALGVVNLPRGSVQAAQIRAAVLRNKAYKESRHKILKKVILILFVLCIVGGGVWFVTTDAETQQTIVDSVASIPSHLNIDEIKNIALTTRGKISDTVYNLIARNPTTSVATTSTTTLVMDQTPEASNTFAQIPQITETPIEAEQCGSFNYVTAQEEAAGISGSACFKTHFDKCTPAIFSATLDDYTTSFTIKNGSGNTCLIEEAVTGPSLTNPQKLICAFDNSQSWEIAQENSSKVCKPVR